MIVNEIFYSLQGEGRLVGVPSVFLRLSGCPLRCKWCDTAYAWDEKSGCEMTIQEIVSEVTSFNCDHLVITGGEPFLCAGFSDLVKAMRSEFKHITVETSGVKYISGLDIDLVSISPKLGNSLPMNEAMQEQHREFTDDFEQAKQLVENYDSQLKFVVEGESDLNEINDFLAGIGNRDKSMVMLMPQARTREEYIERAESVVKICIANGFAFSPRLHVMLWGDKRGV